MPERQLGIREDVMHLSSSRHFMVAVGLLVSLAITFAPGHAQQSTLMEALTSKGVWSADVIYHRDDIVTARGSTWRAKRASKNKVPGQTQPSTAADWELWASGFNPLGAWVSATKYQPNDLVTSNGSTWRARRTNINKAPIAGPNWEQFAAVGATGPNTGITAGTQSAPGISFTGDPDTGIFHPGADQIALVEGGELFLHSLGNQNTALGSAALADTTGAENTAVGNDALENNTTGNGNTAVGAGTLALNETGQSNTAVGKQALILNTTGSANTAVGLGALGSNDAGGSNTAVGNGALGYNMSGGINVAIGSSALLGNVDGSNNIAIGDGAGGAANSPANSIFIGNPGIGADNNTLKIGTEGTQQTAFIAGIRGKTTGVADAITVMIDSSGQLGTVSSSRRYKYDIETMADVTAMLAKLRPVSFRYKQQQNGGDHPLQYGLIAEDVAEVFPGLAVLKDGQPETVKYHLLPTFLLAGWQAQQKTIAAQAQKIDALERRLAAIEERLPPVKEAAARP
jgi:hypothetical protein